MIYYFDTNIFRFVAEGDITEDQLKLFMKGISPTDDCQVSPITIVELASHLTAEESKNYPKFRRAFAAIETVCKGKILPGPDSFLVKHLLSIDSYEDISVWDFFIRRVIESNSLLELDKQIIEADLDGTRYAKKLSTEVLVNFREDYEKNYLEDMAAHVLPHSNPAYSLTKTGVQNGDLRKKLLAVVDSDVFRKEFIEGLFFRVKRLLFNPPSPDEIDIEKSAEMLSAFFGAYKNILRRLISTGYNYIEKKNDYADIHLLIYLMNKNFIFVTNDIRLRNLVDENDIQRLRIKTFDELLSDFSLLNEKNDDSIEKMEWEKSIVEPEEVKIFRALADPKWDFRTLEGISKVTGISGSDVKKIILKYPNFIRRSPVSNYKDQDLFTLTSRAVSFKERFEVVRSLLIGREE